jgi:NADPH2:quinone reductase
MKAILLRCPGDASALEYVEVPTPVPGDGEVLVKADTIGVSMPEVLVRRGTYAWMPPLPAIPGIELSRTVVGRGRDVTEPAPGQPVFVSARDLPVRAGCYAEYIAVPADAVHSLPAGCELEAAACLSNYQVAYHVLHTAAPGSPQSASSSPAHAPRGECGFSTACSASRRRQSACARAGVLSVTRCTPAFSMPRRRR